MSNSNYNFISKFSYKNDELNEVCNQVLTNHPTVKDLRLNRLDKKAKEALSKFNKESLLILLYEFCLIDTFDKDRVNYHALVPNYLKLPQAMENR